MQNLQISPAPPPQTEPRRPILRYHGGKWKLADWIIFNMPAHRTYVEPFGGGGSVLIRKGRSYAEIYNDLDGEIVNLFRVYRDQGKALRELILSTPFARDEFVESYELSPDPLEQARRTLVRSFMGFGSNSHNRPTGFRCNSNRSGTTPAHDWANYPDAMPALIERLRGVVIENRDAMQVMAQQDSDETLHYVDPPYLPETRDPGGDYRHEMTEQQHIELARFLNQLKGAVVVSGYQSEMYMDMYAGWRCVSRKAHADGASPRIEVLWIKGESRQHAMVI